MPVQKVPEEARESIVKLQQYQQQLQALMMQKQSIQLQQQEVENALKELKNNPKSIVYELVGNILIKKTPQALTKSLTEKKDTAELRLESIDKQIDRITKKAQNLQKELTSMKGGGA